jgi:small subunit ribosomal protein S1
MGKEYRAETEAFMTETLNTDETNNAAATATPTEPTPDTATTTADAAPAEQEHSAADEDNGLPELPQVLNNAEFNKLVEAAFADEPIREGDVLTARVQTIDESTVTVALGQYEANIHLDEFLSVNGEITIAVGDEIDVFVEKTSDDLVLSKEKADKLALWNRLEDAEANDEELRGKITGRINGGLTVELGLGKDTEEPIERGIRAFLPGSQVSLRAGRDLGRFLGEENNYRIIKFNRKRGNIVVSHRVIEEKGRAAMREETLLKLKIGAALPGIVRNLTDFGAFVDLGGIDALLHVTDMSWGRIKHPKQVVSVGDELMVQVLRHDPNTQKVSVGLKQLSGDPWLRVKNSYREGQIVDGKVVSLTDFGAFVSIEDGVEGLVHISEMSWTERVNHPKEAVKKGQTLRAMVIGIDLEARRISLSVRQTQPNPWSQLEQSLPIGSKIRGPIKSVTNFGVFIQLQPGIDGLVHISDLSWADDIKDPTEHFEKGNELEAIVLNIDAEAQRVSLGIKQLEKDPWRDIDQRYAVGSAVSGKIVKLLDFGAIVELEQYVEGLVHVSEVSIDHIEKLEDVLSVDQTVEATVISVSAAERKIGLSIKRRQMGDLSDFNDAGSAPTTIGDLIKEKIDVSSLPAGED